VFGPGDSFFNRFAGMARMLPVLPLIGSGHTRFQPVYVADVAGQCVRAVSPGAAVSTLAGQCCGQTSAKSDRQKYRFPDRFSMVMSKGGPRQSLCQRTCHSFW
jgi:hypothetical protein